MLWLSIAAASSLVILGDTAFRAPDGISTVAVGTDLRPWVMSPQGEVTGFDTSGRIRTSFQACPDRGAHLEFALSPDGTHLGVACGVRYRVFDLPSGRLRAELEIAAAHAAFSWDGRQLGIVGERVFGDETEAHSQFLRYRVDTNALISATSGEYDWVAASRNGWVLALGDEFGETLKLRGLVHTVAGEAPWSWEAPPARLASGRWESSNAVSIVDDGRTVCVAGDGGGVCLDVVRGEKSRPWRPADAPFYAPDHGALARDRSNKVQYRVFSTHLAPFAQGPSTTAAWGLPVEVHITPDGTRFLLRDHLGKLFLGSATESRQIAETDGPVAISPSGRFAWYPIEDRSVRVERATARRTILPPLGAAVFDGSDVLWGLEKNGEDNRLVKLLPDDGVCIPVQDLSNGFEVSALQYAHEQLLVEHIQDDAYEVLDLTGQTLGASGSHAFHSHSNLSITAAGLRAVTEVEQGWSVGPVTYSPSTLIRWLGDGAHYLTLEDDSTTLQIHAFPQGTVLQTHTLPGRVHDVWASHSRVLIALRDGRLAILTL